MPLTSKPSISEQFKNLLSPHLLDADLRTCLSHVENLEPTVGKQFWEMNDGQAGFYLILAGKVRLLDQNDQLLITLEAGATFAEASLFPEGEFENYRAKASVGLQLGYLPNSYLQHLISSNSHLRTQLQQRAERLDLLVRYRQQPALRDISGKALLSLIEHLDKHILQTGRLPKELKSQRLWLLRRGQLIHSTGEHLTADRLYVPTTSAWKEWQATETTELYSISEAQWATVLQIAPQLAALSAEESSNETVAEPVNVLPFPERRSRAQTDATSSSKKQPKFAGFPQPKFAIRQWWRRQTRQYPFLEQQSASDCGAACLAMICRYWGKTISINQLREMANVTRNGASLRGLATAAESLGFTTRPVRGTLNKLAEQSLPAIAHWQGNHYIVVYEINHKFVIVADPAIGKRKLTHAEFKTGWTGYTLLLQPTRSFEETEESRSSVWSIFSLVKPYGWIVFEVVLASILIQVFSLVTPIFTQLILDRVVVQGSMLTLTSMGIGLLVFGIFRVAMAGLRQYLLDYLASRINLTLIVGFIRHTFRLPLQFFENRYVGDIISRVQENRKIQRFLTGQAMISALDLLTVFVYLILMFRYSWKLAALSLLVVPPFLLLAFIGTPFLKNASRKTFKTFAAESSYLVESLTGISTIKSLNIEQTVRWRWEDQFIQSLKAFFSSQVIGGFFQLTSSGIETIATTVMLWFGAWLVIKGELTIGQLVAFNMLLGNIIRPFQQLSNLWNEFQEVVVALERINDVMDAEPEASWQQQLQPIHQLQGQIRFEQVTFRYHPESDVNTLENLSFEIQPGQTVAIIGRSGSGKTTLSKLLLGLYPPTQGRILIDGFDITSLDIRSLRPQVGVVDQNSFLFGDTIRANIAMGSPDASLEEIMAAAQQAGAHSFIQELPMGYETQVGERGGMLSGGQRQRLTIARALVGNPRLLILDEATSSLDAESERIIQGNLSKISQNRTTLIIAHRLSTIRNADLILVLDRGVLIEKGTHAELMATRGHYYYLNQQQLATVG
jgi:ATP-binding cassette subfamily B protein